MKTTVRNLLFLFILLFIQAKLTAQTSNASFISYPTDDANEAAPGTTISVRNEPTGFSTTTMANSKSEYAFVPLPLDGPYTITIGSVGFAPKKRTGHALNQGDIMRVDVPMKSEGQTFGIVVVNATSPISTLACIRNWA